MTEDNLEQGTQANDGGQPDSAQDQPDSTSQGPGPDQQGDGQSSDSGPDNSQETQAEGIVFDPREFDRLKGELPGDVKGQLEAFMKGIQGDYTRKNQALSETRRKVEAYNAFEQNPRGTMEQLAQQMGYKLVPVDPGQGKGDQSNQYQGWQPEKGNPESWNDVTGYLGHMVENLMQKHMGTNMAPVFQQLQEYRKTSIESRLNDIDPAWRQYEEAMMKNLSKYPAMADDVDLLYRASVPNDVFESRATQKAQARMQAKIKSSQVSGGSTTRNKAEEDKINSKPRSFEEAYQLAKETLAKQGIVKSSAQ